jgi:hypothetical protein
MSEMMVEKIGRTGELERSIVVRYFASLTSKVSDKSAQQLIVAMQDYAVAERIVNEDEKSSIEITPKMVTAVMEDLKEVEYAPATSVVWGPNRRKLFTIEPKMVMLKKFMSDLLAGHKMIADKRVHEAGQQAKKDLKLLKKEMKVINHATCLISMFQT